MGSADRVPARQTLGVKRAADPKDNDRPGVAEDGMSKFFGKLGNVLVRRNQRETPLARFREDRCETVGREVLEFINVQREIAALIFRLCDVAPRLPARPPL